MHTLFTPTMGNQLYRSFGVVPNSFVECRPAPKHDELYHCLVDFRDSNNKSVFHIQGLGAGPKGNRKDRIVFGGSSVVSTVTNAVIESQIDVKIGTTSIEVFYSGGSFVASNVGEVSKLTMVVGVEKEKDNGAYHPWYGRTIVYHTPEDAPAQDAPTPSPNPPSTDNTIDFQSLKPLEQIQYLLNYIYAIAKTWTVQIQQVGPLNGN